MDIWQIITNLQEQVQWIDWGVIACGILFLQGVAFGVVWVKKQKRQARLKREMRKKTIQYTLPARDNRFVRDRLNTVLNVAPEEERTKRKNDVRLSYAIELLHKLKNKPLSVVDRLQVNDAEKTLGLFLEKQELSSADVRTLSDTMTAILKTSAKYDV